MERSESYIPILDGLFNYDPHVVGVKGLLFIGKKLLIYRRDTNTTLYPLHLDVPGGGREADETPFQTFQREVGEEFGLELGPENMVYAERYALEPKSDKKVGFFVVATLPSEAEFSIRFGSEGTEYFLLDPMDYLNRPDAWPTYQNRAARYLTAVGLADSSQLVS